MTTLTLLAPAADEEQLVPVYRGEIGGIPANVVNARELHTYLESRSEFANWIKHRIEKYGFVENQDFEVFESPVKNPQGGRPATDYLISLDMAKELSMVENNTKGREARRYFIAMERKALESAGQVVPASHQETLTPSEQQTLSEIVHHKVASLEPEIQGKALAEAWSRLHRKFRVAKYSQLPRTHLSEAIVYVAGMELRCATQVRSPEVAVPLETISAAELHKLSHIVYMIKNSFHMDGSASHAAYAGLRKRFGLESGIASLPAAYFDQAVQVLTELEKLAFNFKGIVLEAERKFFRQVLRSGKALDEDEFNRLFDAELQQMIENHRDSLKLLN